MSGIFLLLLIGFAAAQPNNDYYPKQAYEYRNLADNPSKQQKITKNLCEPATKGPVINPFDQVIDTTVPQPNIANRNSFNDVTGNPFENFNTKLYQIIAPALLNSNLVYSPISLQTLLSFVYTGSQNNTAFELQRALELPKDKTTVGNLFQQLFESQKSTSDAELIMANKMYYGSKLRVKSDFMKRAKTQFDAEIESTEFNNPEVAAWKINRWIAEKTQNHINNLISPGTLDPNTQGILVNAIYFKAKWAKEFSTSDTGKKIFRSSRTSQETQVDMMYNDDVYRYGEIPELQASILEMPYNNSNLSMMIILPNDIDGLPFVEQNLQNWDFTKLASRLRRETVVVQLPKFRVEFELDMIEPLIKLGVKDLFTSNANLEDFFENNQQMSISKVQHKAFIDVNEAGSEAAAASFVKIIPLSLPAKLISFTVDHPFIFAIRGPNVVYFIGHVVNL